MKNYNPLAIFYLTVVGTVLVSQCPKSTFSQSRNIDPEIQKKIDDFIQNNYFPASGVSGLGLTIVQDNGEVLYTTGYGLADKERGILNKNSTQFLVASISKSFTAVVGAKLLHEKFPDLGEAVLDTPIRKLFPELNFTLIDRFRSEHTTFRDLVSHRMCLVPNNWHVFSEAINTTEEILYRTRYEKELCGFRTEFQYNNPMYAVAGGVISHMANKSFEDAIKDFTNDLGMLNSTFTKLSDDFSQMPFRAMPYYVMDNEMHPMNTDLTKRIHLVNPSGGMFTTPNDMAIYMWFHLNLGNISGRQVVPKEVMEWLSKPSNMVASSFYAFKDSDNDSIVNQFGYGLGLFLGSYDGWQYIHHSGHYVPYTSQMSLYPAKKLGIFSSTNMGPNMVDQMVLHAFIFETMIGNDEATATLNAMRVKAQLDAEKERKGTKAGEELQSVFDGPMKTNNDNAVDIVGKYGSGSGGEMEISKKFNAERNRTELYLEYGRWYTGWLEQVPDADNLFKLSLDTDIIQDNYATGDREGLNFARVDNGTLTFFILDAFIGSVLVTGEFELGLRSDLLPPVPWSPDSCGPEYD